MREISEMLGAWNSFYVMVGSAAAALTGLMFVVITLVSGRNRGQASEDGLSTFSTPTVVHFSTALLIAAVMSAPFPTLVPIAIISGLVGLGGACYAASIGIRTAKLSSYEPDLEDWTWHTCLPFVAYALLVLGACTMHPFALLSLYAPATAVILLIFIGIHNAWDVVTFLALGKADELPDAPSSVPAATPTPKTEST